MWVEMQVTHHYLFFPQVVPNSCATHALLSVLMNCSNLNLGSTISRLKEHTSGMSPENKVLVVLLFSNLHFHVNFVSGVCYWERTRASKGSQLSRNPRGKEDE